MESIPLSQRESQILQALVKTYILLGTPVGSQAICQREMLGISAATVRNTLASLEEKGYVQQPHTSAGRVPTDRGYRFYVWQCMAEGRLGEEEDGARLRAELEAQLRAGDIQEILTQLAKIIGDISHQLGLVLAPRFEQGVFHKMELVQLAENRLLLVVTIRQGLVKSLVVEVDSAVSREELEGMSRLLNEQLHGLNMAEIQRTVHARVRSLQTGNPQLLRAVVDEIEAMALPGPADLHVAGTRNICLQPEFHDPLRVAGLLDLVEKKEMLAQLMGERRGIVITIGAEHATREMRLCSMVTASYEVNGALGVIGVIGPTRMPYGPVVALVNYAASRAAQLVS